MFSLRRTLLFLTVCVSTSTPSNVKFSKLLNEKSEFLRFTSIAAPNGENSPRFQNVYNRAEDVQQPQALVGREVEGDLNSEFPQSKLITEPNGENDFVRIQQGQTSNNVEPERSTLTRINQKQIQGRNQVTALRQSSGKRLNISPVFLTDAPPSDPPPQNEDDVTESPEDEDYENEVTTVQNFEVTRDHTTPAPVAKERPVVQNVTTTPGPRWGVTVFDNRSNPDPVHSTTPVSLDFEEDENLVAESFHRNGHFPDFEDLPTHLTGSESNPPARVNVRPASSGKDYEYEYIYYYYDDEDGDNSTTPSPTHSQSTSKADLTGVKGTPNSFQISKPEHSPSNFLESPSRGQKSFPAHPDIVSLPNPTITAGLTPVVGTENGPIVIKQSNMFPLVPRANSNVPAYTTPRPETTTEVLRHLPENKLNSQPPAANQFAPPIIQFKFVESPVAPVTTTQAPVEPQRQRGRNPFFQRPQAQPEPVAAQADQPQETPIPRRSPSRKPPQNLLRPETEVQQQEPPTTSARNTIPAQRAVATEEISRIPPRLRATTPFPPSVAQGQFLPPLIPSRGREAIVEIQSPSLETTSQGPIGSGERNSRENFARQKSVNDLYALSRLHQLAINTKIPDKRGQDFGGRGSPPRNSGGFLTTPELVTVYPDNMEGSESTTISSFLPTSIFTTAEVQKISIPTRTTTTTTTTTEEATLLVAPTNEVILNSNLPALNNERQNSFRDRGNNNGTRFRGRNRPSSSTPSTSTSTSSTTEAAPRTYQHNRFAGGRRRNFPQSVAPSPVEPEAVEPSFSPLPSFAPTPIEPEVPQPSRAPGRNRFGGRTRPTTSSTSEAPVSLAPVPVESRPRISNRKPLTGGQLAPRRRLSTSTLPPVDNQGPSESSPDPIPSESPAPSVEDQGGRRPLPGRIRNRPAGVGPIVGRPLRGGRTTSTTPTPSTTTTTEYPDGGIVTVEDAEAPGETVGTTVIDPSPTPQVAPAAETPIITQKISVSSSSTTSESAEPPKRGSAGVLGRLRSRSKVLGTGNLAPAPAHLPTPAPEVITTTTERKASRVSGILNRRKTTSTTSNPVPVDYAPAHELPEGIPPNGVIVQVSSVVSESQDAPVDHSILAEDSNSVPSTTTQGSIINRLKTQRKPGALFRKRNE